jgi:membrane associated rhomboid family serine protease
MKNLKFPNITYNSPVIITYFSICVFVLIACSLNEDLVYHFVSAKANISRFYTLFTHTLGHLNTDHLISNFLIILLIGPMVEEKYGSHLLVAMLFFNALATGLLNVVLFDNGVIGASGNVFMLITLSSFVNFKRGQIPLTFILVSSLYIGSEVINSFSDDNISHFGHITGAIIGIIYGFMFRKYIKN